MDPQVSFARLLIGDNDRTSPTYTDAEIRSVCNLGPPPALPRSLLIVGFVTFVIFPVGAGA